MRFLHNPSTNAHYNMAFDEYCLEQFPLDEPVFYLWQNAPSVIIGLNQNAYTEVNLPYLEEKGILLARRVTGGGAVYHDLQNLNYTIVGRSADLEHDYPGYLTVIIDALRSLGVTAELSGRNDILIDGHKVSGYAKRVWKDRLMVHGTLMYDVDLNTLSSVLAVSGDKLEAHGIASVKSRVTNLKKYLPQFTTIADLQAALEDILSRNHADAEVILSKEQLSQIADIARTKFATWEWNYGRSPMVAFRHKKKFACGTIEVHFSVEKGSITQLAFEGDFLGGLPASTLVPTLIGCRYDKESLQAVLDSQMVASCFDGLTPDNLVDLLF